MARSIPPTNKERKETMAAGKVLYSMRKDTWRVAVSAAAIAMVAMPSFAATPVFETKDDDANTYTFGSPVESGETAQSNIGSASSANGNRFAFRSGIVNVKEGGYVRVSGYDSTNKTYGNWCGCNGNSATLNVMGGTFWIDKGNGSQAGQGRLRIGVNSASNGRTGVARVNVSAGLFRVDNILMCGASIYNANTSQNAPAEMTISGGTAVVENFWLGARTGTLSSTAEFNLTGGELQVNSFVFQPYHSQTFNWGSGKIVAGKADVFTSENLAGNATRTVNVTGAPAVFDTGNFAQTIPADIASGTGTLKLAGGNTVTLSAAPSFGLWLDGTTLAFNSALGRNLTVHALTIGSGAGIAFDSDLLLAGEAFTLTATGGFTLPDGGAVLDFVQINGSSTADCEKTLSPDGKTITISKPGDPDYTWRGTAANWGAVDAWMNGGSNATWADRNIAIFNTANATVTLNNDVTAAGIVFNANATIATNGTDSATLTVPTVSVANGVSATISAPIVGAFEKTGAGALTLTENRTATTTLSEGSLKMSGTASLDWSQFTFGTDPAKPVALDVGAGATLANIPSAWEIGYGANITSSVVKAGGDWTNTYLRVGGASGAAASFYHNGGSLTLRGAGSSAGLIVGYASGAGASYFELNDSTVTCLSYPIIGNSSAGEMVVTNNGSLVSSGSVYIGRDNGGCGILTVVDGGTVSADGSLVFNSASAAGIGVVNLANGGVISAVNAYRSKAGSATFNFDGGTFVKASETGNVFPVNGAASAIDVSVSTNGGTIDNNGLAITIPCTITGVGGLTISGAGTTTVSADQSYSGTTTVSNGTTLAVSGVTLAGPLALEAGSTLNLVSYTPGVTPVVASALALPESGTVALTLNGGAFPVGVYAICSATGGVAASDGNKFVPSTGGGSFAWSVSGNTLVLTVGEVSGNMWTGLAGDGRISSAANWLNGVPAADADIDFSSVVSAVTINADLERTFGSVTMGTGVITFTNAIAATNFTDTSKISVGADSTVTVVGDLEISGETSRSIVYTIAAGGKFVVTGDIIATEDFSGSDLYPSVTMACPGTFVARGLVNRGTVGRSFRLYNNGSGSHVTWVIGDHGISSRGSPGATGAAGFWCFNYGNSSATIIADADFTIAAWLTNREKLVLNTTGRDGAPHTITIGDGTTGLLDNDGFLETTGAGKVLFNCVSTFSGGHPVYGTSTVAVNPGCRAGNNTIHLYEGTSLEVAQSGTVTLAGDLKLDNNTALAFNFTERRKDPVLALAEGKSVVFAEGESTNITVKVSGIRPTGGEKLLTTCRGFNAEGVTVSLADDAPKWVKSVYVNADGNIVLDVKPMGTKVIVR